MRKLAGLPPALLVSVASLVALGSVQASAQELVGTPAIRYALSKLNVLGSVLMIAAHPDDENNAVLAWCARGRKVRTGYLSMTRGEGGQNLLGPEQGALLGVVRTQELLAARRIDGADQYFTRAIDFGFTKTMDEAIQKWGHERILSDIVWVIRQQQPDVVILCFSGTPADGHGQHQASAVLGKEAVAAAADASRFPEQLKWVKPWRVHTVMQSRFVPPGVNAPAQPAVPTLTLQAGDYDPVLGRTYREIASISRNEHKSQAMVSTIAYGQAPVVMAYVSGAAPKNDLFDGVDLSWNRVPGAGRIGETLARAEREFDDLHPERTAATLLEARAAVLGLARGGQTWARWKLTELDRAIALCAGLLTEAQAGVATYIPGATAKLQLTAINRSRLPIALTAIHLAGWGDADVPVKATPLAYGKTETTAFAMPIPAGQAYSQPFWLRTPNNGNYYEIADQSLIGRADIVPEVMARFDFTLNGQSFSIEEPLHHRYAEPSKEEFTRPVVVQPPVAVDLTSRNFVLGLGAVQTVNVSVRALERNQAGTLRLEAPAGWQVSPVSAAFDLKELGAAREVVFRVTPPVSASEARFRLVAKLAGGPEVATGVDTIDYAHIPAQTVMLPSEGKFSAIPLTVLAKRVGYVMGSSDNVPEALRQMGCRVELLGDQELSSGDLSVYDAIVTGVRAYGVRADLRANQKRLLEYVEKGGTLIVQYNNSQDRRIGPSVADALDHLGPYPFSVPAGNGTRVTDENAPVEFVSNSSILHFPNEITHTDFEGWIQERGLYYADKWDTHYDAPLDMHDPGEKSLRGGLLYTRYGKGAYIFTALAWFRELPGGVPGAYRIFANLLSAGKAPQ